MINVYPNPGLGVNYLFNDSQGKMLSLHPAESLEPEKPQVFDESDPLVAEMILARVKDKTVRLEKGDKALLEQTIAEAKAIAVVEAKSEAPSDKRKGVKAAVAEAHAEYADYVSPEDHQAAIDEAVAKAVAEAAGAPPEESPPKSKGKAK